jgi:hypothetical protein
MWSMLILVAELSGKTVSSHIVDMRIQVLYGFASHLN